MKKGLSLVLTIAIIVALLPQLMITSRADTLYQGYIELLEDVIDSNVRVNNRLGYGELYDIDGNGVKELVIAYYTEKTVVEYVTEQWITWGVYTISNDKLVTLRHEKLTIAGVGSNSAYISCIKLDGKQYIAVKVSGGEGGISYSEHWKLYTLSGTSLTLSVTAECTENRRNGNTTASINGKSCSSTEYNAWKNRMSEVKFVYDYENWDNKKQTKLEDLLAQLKNVSSQDSDVMRIYGADRYQTAFKVADELKEVLGLTKFQNIVVASGASSPDAKSGSYLAAQKNAPILLVSANNVNAVKDYIKKNLVSGGTVYLLGGVAVVPKAMDSGLEGFKVKRLGGATRYDTCLLILKEVGVGSKDILVCSGKGFADSLCASATGLPILLVKDGLTAAQKEFLAETSGRIVIVGGKNAVPTAIEKQLKSYGSVKRLAGSTRYETSILVAQEFFSNPTSAVLAYAQNFPDGLSGGPLAYAIGAPLILTDSNKPTAAINYATGLGIKSGYVLGGTGLISDTVVKKIFSLK